MHTDCGGGGASQVSERARKNEKRSDRVEWEHVVPAFWFGADRACWKGGGLALRQEGRQSVQGLEVLPQAGCRSHLRGCPQGSMNLFPSGGEVNGDRRSNHPYGTVQGEPLAINAPLAFPEPWDSAYAGRGVGDRRGDPGFLLTGGTRVVFARGVLVSSKSVVSNQ